MALFPTFGPEYYDEKDKSIKARMENFYSESISLNQSFWGEADIDTRFEAGDQTLWNEVYGSLPAGGRKQFSFNRIRRIINMISGHQRRNRHSSIVIPIENGDQETADQFSKVLMWANNREGVLDTLSKSFHGALVTGMNLMQVWVDYRSDPISGNIKVDNCSYNSFLVDPYFREPDLSDCNSIWKRTFLTSRECISLLPNKADEIASLRGVNNRDGKFNFLPENYNYGMKNLLTYDEFYYKDYRTQTVLVDTVTGESQEWQGKSNKDLKEFLSFYPSITTLDQEVPTVKLAIVIEGKVMYHGPNPIGVDTYPFVPVLGYYNPQIPYYPLRVQGVVRGLRDAQYLYNRRKQIELDVLESQINSGWKYKENALVNPKDVFLSGSGRGLALKEEALMSDVEKIQPAQVPPSMIELSNILAREIQEISGVNEELLGSAQDDKAGILSMLRQGAGLTTLQILFDQLDYSQKILGRLMLSVIQNNFTPGKIKKIIEEEPKKQFYNKNFGVYDADIVQGFNTVTQKQTNFVQLLQLKEVGVPIPDIELLKAATLQNKTELISTIEADQKAKAELAAKQEQLELERLKATVKVANAQAVANEGLGLERISRIRENHALAEERSAQAYRDRESAGLEHVKMLKELQEMDISQIEKLLALANVLKKQEEASEIEQMPAEEVHIKREHLGKESGQVEVVRGI
jgi:hypothetical protein